jgi:hypothetical protein
VLAPEKRIEKGIFRQQIDAQHIHKGISQRVSMYPPGERQEKRRLWLDEWVRPLIDRIQLDCVGWEDILNRITATEKTLVQNCRISIKSAFGTTV